MLGRLFGPVLIACALGASASAQDQRQPVNETPVWGAVPALVCRETHAATCHFSDDPGSFSHDCPRTTGRAFWRVDFRANLVKYLQIEHQEKIIAKQASTSRGRVESTVFLESRRMLSFVTDRKPDWFSRPQGFYYGVLTSGPGTFGENLSVTTNIFECVKAD